MGPPLRVGIPLRVGPGAATDAGVSNRAHLLGLDHLVLLAAHEHVLDASHRGTGGGQAGGRSKVGRDSRHLGNLGLRGTKGAEG